MAGESPRPTADRRRRRASLSRELSRRVLRTCLPASALRDRPSPSWIGVFHRAPRPPEVWGHWRPAWRVRGHVVVLNTLTRGAIVQPHAPVLWGPQNP